MAKTTRKAVYFGTTVPEIMTRNDVFPDVNVPERQNAIVFSADATNWVRNWSAPGMWRCGGFDTPNPTYNPTSDSPFQALTILNYLERPHHYHQAMESNLSTGANSGYEGAEDGEYVEAGLLTYGRKLTWGGTFEIMCATHDDTLVEFVIEPNHVVGSLTGADRMRFVFEQLSKTWTGYVDGNFSLEIAFVGNNTVSYRGSLVIPGVYEDSVSGELELNTVDLSVDDTVWCPRFRIDRDANLNTYDDTYQVNSGVDGDATERELVVNNAWFRGV